MLFWLRRCNPGGCVLSSVGFVEADVGTQCGLHKGHDREQERRIFCALVTYSRRHTPNRLDIGCCDEHPALCGEFYARVRTYHQNERTSGGFCPSTMGIADLCSDLTYRKCFHRHLWAFSTVFARSCMASDFLCRQQLLARDAGWRESGIVQGLCGLFHFGPGKPVVVYLIDKRPPARF